MSEENTPPLDIFFLFILVQNGEPEGLKGTGRYVRIVNSPPFRTRYKSIWFERDRYIPICYGTVLL